MELSKAHSSKVFVRTVVLSGLETYISKKGFDVERGGILLGKYRGPHIEIVGWTSPGRLDRCSRYRFDKRDPKHQIIAHMHWRRSGGKITYVGEWHTHPESTPSPSYIDRRTWEGLVRKIKAPMFFMIIGHSDIWFGHGHKLYSNIKIVQSRNVEQHSSGTIILF